jgi:hypothetical protein
MQDVASRLRGRVQLTTDGHRPYLAAVEDAFGADIDYAILQKLYGAEADSETRYSPAVCIGCKVETVTGDPDPKHISTSYVERQNLTMRMSMRRFTRLTNAFSKKVENHAAAIALYFMFYNFGRIHQTLRVTPAMEAGIENHVWSVGGNRGITRLMPRSSLSWGLFAQALVWLSSERPARERIARVTRASVAPDLVSNESGTMMRFLLLMLSVVLVACSDVSRPPQPPPPPGIPRPSAPSDNEESAVFPPNFTIVVTREYGMWGDVWEQKLRGPASATRSPGVPESNQIESSREGRSCVAWSRS